MALWTWRSALCAALRSAKEIGVYADLQTLQVHAMVSRSLSLSLSNSVSLSVKRGLRLGQRPQRGQKSLLFLLLQTLASFGGCAAVSFI